MEGGMNLTYRRATALDAIQGAVGGALVAVGLIVLVFVAIEGARLVTERGRGDRPPVTGALDAAAAPPQHAVDAETIQIDRRLQVLTNHLARRYRVASEPTEELVHAAFAAGRLTQIDPLLILAVIAIESRFNPIAESNYGARGLMQVVPRFHLGKLAGHGGEATLLEPHTNILVGTRILDEYIQRAGSLEAGLQLYNGAADDPARGYAQRVLAEQQRLMQVLQSVPVRPNAVALRDVRS
jgi:soluble lytic murein transglycosylase-like protein